MTKASQIIWCSGNWSQAYVEWSRPNRGGSLGLIPNAS